MCEHALINQEHILINASELMLEKEYFEQWGCETEGHSSNKVIQKYTEHPETLK